MIIRNVCEIAYCYSHIFDGEVIYAYPVLAIRDNCIKTNGVHGRTFIMDLSLFKSMPEELSVSDWIYLKHNEVVRFRMFNTKMARCYLMSEMELLTAYEEVD